MLIMMYTIALLHEWRMSVVLSSGLVSHRHCTHERQRPKPDMHVTWIIRVLYVGRKSLELWSGPASRVYICGCRPRHAGRLCWRMRRAPRLATALEMATGDELGRGILPTAIALHRYD